MFNEGLDLPTPELVLLWKASEEYADEKIASEEEKFKISKFPSWDFDQGTGKITFFTADSSPAVVADFSIVGSFSLDSHTWQWGWANDDVEEKEQMSIVKKYGEEHKIRSFVEPTFPSTPARSFELTSVAAYILRSELPIQLANNVDGEVVGYIYLVLSNITKA